MQERCSLAEFQNWIAPIQVLESSTEELVLQVPNIFVQEYLLQNYKKELLGFVPVHADGQLALRFVIAEEEKKPLFAPEVAPNPTPKPFLNPLYTFEHFIEGPSNQFVKSAALGIAAHPGKSYNPLFIHGSVGLGKTHVLHAIGHAALKHNKRLKIHCITTEGFINDIVENLKKKSMDKMKKFYRSLDILLVDDIQFLQSRLNFEEEFCNTFESLIQQNKQIVITSDKPPSQLKLSERMIARMEWCLVAHMNAPDLETRVAILQHKAEMRGLRLSHPIALFIAKHIFHNVRQLEGAINKLTAFSKLIGKELTEEVIETTLGELFQHEPRHRISIENILRCVAAIFEVRISDLKGSSRTKDIALARQVAMYLAKELMTDSLMKLASAFGGKTHSTLLHGWKKVREQLEKDDRLRKQVEMARSKLEDKNLSASDSLSE
jgi:chromosomal replication initiator protein